jgi:hypothetical protein
LRFGKILTIGKAGIATGLTVLGAALIHLSGAAPGSAR